MDTKKALDEAAAKRLLTTVGIAIPRGEVIRSPEEVPSALTRLSFPLVAKIISPDAIHKSDVGGVKLGLQSPDEVIEAVRQLEMEARARKLRIEGFLIEEMASGQELVIGGVIDERFGPVLMLGLGGVFIEVLRDIAFRICPLDHIDAKEMISDLRGAPLLRGARGRPAVSEAALVQMILAIGGEKGLLVTQQDQIAELDINPVILDSTRAIACDARVILRESKAA